MPGFVISYVPNVENVDNIELLKKVNSVDEVTKVDEVVVVDTVNDVKQVDNVTWVETVDNVNTVHDVRKLPHPYFPLKKYNFQPGGMVHITTTQNMYQAVFIPPFDCEFKGIHLCFTSYNIEDTYDVMIGSRYICQGSHVKEMSEYRMLEVYEDVIANTPIVVQYYNNSGLEKYLLYEFVTLVDVTNMNTSDMLSWSFDWQDPTQQVAEQDTCNLVINQPNYVNMDSTIESFTLEVTDLNLQSVIARIECNSAGVVTSDYIEHEPSYASMGLLARTGGVAIVSVTRFDKNIQIVFKNINQTGTTVPHSIEMGIKGVVNNRVQN
jgi:hypothetical protein